ncbi:hypothetical protein BH09SUM1_BH09SUM1_30730 [soil metagenome]
MSVFLPEIKPAAMVTHPKFGKGKVTVRYGEDKNSKVIVKFQEEGEKKLAIQHAKLVVHIPEPEPLPLGPDGLPIAPAAPTA